IDILVNNAGKMNIATFDEFDIKVDRELFEINVFGLVNLTPVFSNLVKNSFSGKHGEAFGGEHKLFEKSMATRRCAELMAIAIANQLEE
ncbi:dehydrogenase/reductase SDR family member 7-like protein, partial [Dinothrombium tinctorium]